MLCIEVRGGHKSESKDETLQDIDESVVEENDLFPKGDKPMYDIDHEEDRATHRFFEADKEEIINTYLEAIEDLDWYRIRTHICHHDEGKPCESWTVEEQKGEIPERGE